MSNKSFTVLLFDKNDHTPITAISDDDIQKVENFVEVMQILFGESEKESEKSNENV